MAHKGFLWAGSCPDEDGKHIHVFFTYIFSQNESLFDEKNSLLLERIVRMLRRAHVKGVLQARPASVVAQNLNDFADLLAKAERGDRDLTLEEKEEFIADLSSNRARSSVWLVRRQGKLMVRKAFSHSCTSFAENELTARKILQDERVVKLLFQKDCVFYFDYIEGATVWRAGLFEFFPRSHAARVFTFLTDLSRQGYAMVDINPSAFIFDRSNNLHASDFEFFCKAEPANDFSLSADYKGQFDDSEAPAKGGYKQHWHDALGGDAAVIMHESDIRYAIRKLLHVLLYRIPRRILMRIATRARITRASYVRWQGLRDGQFHV